MPSQLRTPIYRKPTFDRLTKTVLLFLLTFGSLFLFLLAVFSSHGSSRNYSQPISAARTAQPTSAPSRLHPTPARSSQQWQSQRSRSQSPTLRSVQAANERLYRESTNRPPPPRNRIHCLGCNYVRLCYDHQIPRGSYRCPRCGTLNHGLRKRN